MLCENYCLPRIGKWQCPSDTDQYRRELEKSTREDKLLLRKEQNYALNITAHCDNSNLSPYIVSKKSISTIGKIEFLQGENPFRKDTSYYSLILLVSLLFTCTYLALKSLYTKTYPIIFS